MDFSTVATAITAELTDNAAAITAVLGLSLGTGFVFRLIRRAAK